MKSQLLREAKARIDTPDKWCKYSLISIDIEGNMSRCSIGAMHRQLVAIPVTAGSYHISTNMLTDEDQDAVQLLNKAVRLRVGNHLASMTDVMAFNDGLTTTHADVMALFDRAIELAEAGEVWDELETTKAMEEPEPVKTMDTTKELVNV